MPWSAAILIAVLTGAAAGRATSPPADPVATIRLLASQDEAILRVGERLVVNGSRYCGGAGHSSGMAVQTLAQYGAPYRRAAASVLNVSAGPTVTATVEDGAAVTAGLRPGDVIAAIDGREFATDPPMSKAGDFTPTSVALDIIEAELADGRARLLVLREGRQLTVDLKPRPACRARFDVRAGRSNNASSDGTYVQVSSDLVGQVRTDAELAAILAHELAHSILRHPQRLRGSGPRPRVRDTEIEADRLSVYLLDAAGYPPAAAVDFWARWGRANDLGILSDRSHPGWRKRIRAIQLEMAAISAQQHAGEPVRAPAALMPH